VETDTTFVRADSIVELHAITKIGLHVAVVVGPGHTERENSVRLYHTLNDTGFFKLRMLIVDILNTHQNLFDGLKILFLTGVFCLK
jgi:hypothetical protein